MVKNIIKLLTFFIINNKLRRKTRIKLKTLIYGYHVYTKAKSIGKGLCIGNWSSVNKNTLLGEGVNFNGLKIVGEGNVKIGNYFLYSLKTQLIHTFSYTLGKGFILSSLA